MSDLLGPGIKPMSLALTGGLLTAGPPEKPRVKLLTFVGLLGKKWCPVVIVIFFFPILVSLHIFWVYWLFGFSLLWAAHSYPFLPMFSFVSFVVFLTNQQAFLNMRCITICPLVYRCFLPASVLSLVSFVRSLSLTWNLSSLGHRVYVCLFVCF